MGKLCAGRPFLHCKLQASNIGSQFQVPQPYPRDVTGIVNATATSHHDEQSEAHGAMAAVLCCNICVIGPFPFWFN